MSEIHELFADTIPALLRSQKQQFEDIRARYKFVVRGEGGGTWMVDLTESAPTVSQGDDPADCTITVDSEDLLQIVRGHLNVLHAFRLEKIVIDGAAELALRVGAFFPDTLVGMPEAPAREMRSNFEYNRELYNWYGRNWDIEGNSEARKLGEEWGPRDEIDGIIKQFIAPYIGPESTAAEIGVGGARMAVKVAPRVGKLCCFDLSSEMLRQAKQALALSDNVTFELLDEPRFASRFDGVFDFVYAFDVFLLFDLDLVWRYFQEFARILKPGGHAFVNLLNLMSPDGWTQFQIPNCPTRSHFMTPDIVRFLGERAKLSVDFPPTDDIADSHYAKRDCLTILHKPLS